MPLLKKFAMLVGAIVLALVVAWAAMLYWSSNYLVASVATTEKVLALTFDDGPNPPHTQNLIQLLEKHQVKATFFLKGANVEAFPEDVQAIARAGHEIGNHSYYHKAMAAIGKTAYREELIRTNQALNKVLGYSPHLFRPPYGVQGVGLTRALAELDMVSIGLGVSGADWSSDDPQQIAAAIVDSVAPGNFILLHDGHADVADPMAQDSRAHSVAATALVITALKDRGYRFITVSEMLEK